MLSNISNKLAAAFTHSPKSPSSTKLSPTDSFSLATWPADVTIAGEPLFNRPLTSADLDALQESAGLGPANWWLDPELARSDPIETLSYDEEIGLTAMLRAPFEQVGPIRSAAAGLLDRLNELERLQALAIEEERRRAQGREKKVRHHSTLRLTSGDEEEARIEELPMRSSGFNDGGLRRRETYAVKKQGPAKPAPSSQEGANPKFSRSPERREYKPSEGGGKLQRTYSKNSLNNLQIPDLQRSLNGGVAGSDISGNSTQILGRTFDADQLSDVFPSPRASLERLTTSGHPIPSVDLPREAIRHMTFVQQPAQSRNHQRNETLLPRSSASPMRSGRPSAGQYNEVADDTQLRESLPSRLGDDPSVHKKFSVPDGVGLKASGSGSNLIISSMSDAMALVKEQEMKLRASSGRTGEVNVSLTSSIDGSGGGNGSTGRLNKSLPGDGGSLPHIFAQRGVKDVPQRYDPDGRRNAPSELSRNKSSSQSSLKDMASLNEMIRAQQESLRASGEQIMQRVRSRSSLNQSVGGSPVGSREGSPQVPPLSHKEPVLHQSLERPGDLRVSGATYDLNSSIPSEDVDPPRKSSSPVTMRRPPRGTNIPAPLALPVDAEDITPETPQTAKTARPGSYVDQLQSAKHASSAVEAWVADTVTMNNANVGGVNLAASSESFSGLRASTETYALQEEGPSAMVRPEQLRAPSPRLVQPPQSLLTDNVMTTSQRTVTAKTPTGTPTGKPGVRRAIAPTAIRGGRSGTVPSSVPTGRHAVSSIRPPGVLPRPRAPVGTSVTGRGAPVPQLRPPVPRLRPPSSVPQSRLPVSRGTASKSRSVSRINPKTPER
ncbi:hypothetical protein Aperf_G00000019308 [Anoplocephala perfoliata]